MTEQGLPAGGGLLTIYKTLFLDLPLAGVRQALEAEKRKEAVEAVWKNYDEGMRLATAAVGNLYRDPHFGRALDHALQEMLRWQQFSSNVSQAFLAGLRLTIDLPTATEVRELLKELRTISARHSHAQTPGQVQKQEAREGQLSPPREEFNAANASVVRPSGQQRQEQRTAELLDYFEPVDWDTSAPPDSERARSSSTEDFATYFEPVNYPLVPAPGAKPQRPVSRIHPQKTKTGAIKNLRLRRGPTAAPAGAIDANATQSASA